MCNISGVQNALGGKKKCYKVLQKTVYIYQKCKSDTLKGFQLLDYLECHSALCHSTWKCLLHKRNNYRSVIENQL